MTREYRPIGPRMTVASVCMLVLVLVGWQAIGPGADYSPVAELSSRLIDKEIEQKGLPALSIVLVDDQEIVWAKGFGMADPGRRIPATAETVYRVGSVSKLFTDIAVMQLVEKGELDLDAPVSRYLPGFHPGNPYDRQITLRQLMSHRAGLVREPPLGNYFDPSEPTLEQTVGSLNQTSLVYEPESKTKYSNAGIAVVGYLLEQIQNRSFSTHLQQAVLRPLGMTSSRFEPNLEVSRNLARATMWTYDGRRFPAPTFELGMAPAGSMYSTVADLGRFMSALFRGARGILRPETLEEMYRPQFAEKGATQGYGIGFAISDLEGHRLVRHGGAIYGFATELAFLPDEKLVFNRNDQGVATEVVAAGVLFRRRPVGTEEGETFRIKPLRPVEELRIEAIAARPPKEEGDFREPELVEIARLDPSIKLDIRYAGTNNFMGASFYREPRAFTRTGAATRF